MGKKPEEYREQKDYGPRGLNGREYDTIVFCNGYGPDVPEMEVEFKGVRKTTRKGEPVYAIKLGKILNRRDGPDLHDTKATASAHFEAPRRRTAHGSFRDTSCGDDGVAATAGYENQREHWLGWLKDYNGPGYYVREDWEVDDARTVYNRVGNPAMVLWLGEASGIPTAIVKKAAAEAMKLRGSFPDSAAPSAR